MEEKVVTFEAKLNDLVALAKKKKNILEQQEVLDFFKGVEMISMNFWKKRELMSCR